MDLKISLYRPPRSPRRSEWHSAELQLTRGSAPCLTLRLQVRLSPFRVIAAREGAQASCLEPSSKREWTWPPRRAAA